MTAPHILVTGGAGFLGSHLCEALLARGDTVTCLDDFSTGHADNIADFADHPRFRLVTADVTQPPSGRFDAIANLACPASPRHYQADPVRTTRTAVLGTLAMLELAHASGARLLQASTSEVYGDGAQTRSFCHADDMVGGLMALLDSPRSIAGPVNLGNPQETSMAGLARRIIALTGSASRLVTAELPADDPRQRCPDISLAHDLLGWQPQIPIETGLLRTIDWFRNRLQPA